MISSIVLGTGSMFFTDGFRDFLRFFLTFFFPFGELLFEVVSKSAILSLRSPPLLRIPRGLAFCAELGRVSSSKPSLAGFPGAMGAGDDKKGAGEDLECDSPKVLSRSSSLSKDTAESIDMAVVGRAPSDTRESPVLGL
jgi:hypothetical protein